MSARVGVHEVHDAYQAQLLPAFPIEYFCDLHAGQRLRRECLGQVHGGLLILGGIARTTGIDLYYKRSMGNPRMPQPGEIDDSLRQFIGDCWTLHLRRPGKPKVQRYRT
jgi:hypothetical protein